jgi:arylsulfate sulfotransferase
MKNVQTVLCLVICILFTMASLGCGSGGSTTPPVAAVVPTPHPLVAQYNLNHFHAGLTAWVEFGTDTNYGRQTSQMTSTVIAAGGQTLNIFVAGMKPQTTYHMRAHVTWVGGSWVDQDRTFTTGALPTSQSIPQLSVTHPTTGALATAAPAAGVELLSLVPPANSNVFQQVVTDLQGNIIWFCPGAGTPIKPMPNGHFMLLTGGTALGESDLRELDLACNTIRDISVSQVNQSLQQSGHPFVIAGFHHDVLVLPNGHWIALGSMTKDFSNLTGFPPGTTVTVQGDVLMDIDLNGNVVWAWSAFDHLDVNRHPYFAVQDWTHSNALIYTPDGNLLVSMRAQSWVLKIDYANGTGSGDILWRLGEGGDFILPGDPTQWFYSQHYPNLLSTNGSQMTLAIWDNGNSRLDSTGSIACGSNPSAQPCYSRATIFQVDESTNLASVLWQDLPGFYSFWGGSIGMMSNGNVEFDGNAPSGSTMSQIMEVTQTGSPQAIWQMTITGANAYRGYRIPSLYPGVTWKQ